MFGVVISVLKKMFGVTISGKLYIFLYLICAKKLNNSNLNSISSKYLINLKITIVVTNNYASLNNLYSSLGQNLSTSTFVGEITFAIIVATLGLVLFALLIGNMQVSNWNFIYSFGL